MQQLPARALAGTRGRGGWLASRDPGRRVTLSRNTGHPGPRAACHQSQARVVVTRRQLALSPSQPHTLAAGSSIFSLTSISPAAARDGGQRPAAEIRLLGKSQQNPDLREPPAQGAPGPAWPGQDLQGAQPLGTGGAALPSRPTHPARWPPPPTRPWRAQVLPHVPTATAT